MNRIISMAILPAIMLNCPLTAVAVSFSPIPEQRAEKEAKGIREKGESVCLFHSGTADVKNTISVGDLLTVYREIRKHDIKEVGKIKVLSYIREDYLSGKVVDGAVRSGDIAKKDDTASLVIHSRDRCSEN